jgi:hypothetical protein
VLILIWFFRFAFVAFAILALLYALVILFLIGLAIGKLLWPSFHRFEMNWLRQLSQGIEKPRPGEPVTQVEAFRYAFLVLTEDGVVFHSIAKRTTFGATEVARCMMKQEHRVPDEKCSCGFYALGRAELLIRRTALVITARHRRILLKVRLSRRVVGGSEGYRAGRQDVLCAWASSRCSHFGCRRQAEFMQAKQQVKGVTMPQEPVRPYCARHINGKKAIGKPLTMADLRSQLRTDFEWMPHPE